VERGGEFRGEEEEERPSKRRGEREGGREGGRGLKRGKRGVSGLRREGGARKKGEPVAKRVDRAFQRNRRVTAEAERRVAVGEDWGGSVRDSGRRLWLPVLEQAS